MHEKMNKTFIYTRGGKNRQTNILFDRLVEP